MEGPSASVGTYIIGICHYCKIPRPFVTTLQRCGGCQLVAYCSRDCQLDDRDGHKKICKKFKVVDGKNVFHTARPWKLHLASLSEIAAFVDKSFYIFQNPRVCNTCHEPRQDRLTDCVCNCVSYCSRKCARSDKHHKKECNSLYQLARSKCEHFRDLSYPFSLYWALQSLGHYPVGQARRPLYEAESLNIHVIINQPLFDSKLWEIGLMGLMPQLKHLHLDFIIQGGWSSSSSQSSTGIGYSTCKTRIITHSIHEMHYHMFFSSQKYTDPDVVVIYGNSHEMLSDDMEGTHSEISYRNMTSSRDTVLVIMDATEDLVKKSVNAVNAIRPVEQIVAPRINKLRGWGSNRKKLEIEGSDVNDKYYFSCLMRKH